MQSEMRLASPLSLGDHHPALTPHLSFPILQGDLQKVQEHLCLPDRRSLLSEVQALRAQLRMTHLQNQEKLQQLCAALTSTEARGSQREHQLRRQGGCPCSCHSTPAPHLLTLATSGCIRQAGLPVPHVQRPSGPEWVPVFAALVISQWRSGIVVKEFFCRQDL